MAKNNVGFLRFFLDADLLAAFLKALS